MVKLESRRHVLDSHNQQEDSVVWKWRRHVLDFGILLGCHKQLPDEEEAFWKETKRLVLFALKIRALFVCASKYTECILFFKSKISPIIRFSCEATVSQRVCNWLTDLRRALPMLTRGFLSSRLDSFVDFYFSRLG